MKKIVPIIILLALIVLLSTTPALAAVNIINDIGGTPWIKFPNISDLVSIFLNNAYIIAGIIMFGIIFFAGFMVMSGGAGGDAKKSQQGRDAATWAVIGFVVIFASYWILQIIKAITTLDITKPGI